MIVPRDYQEWAVQALWEKVHRDPTENPLVLMPTGTGKSLVMGMFIWRLLDAYPYLKVMNLTHVKELVAGNYRALLNLWPAAPAGIYSAGLNRRDTRAQVTFASIMSVGKRPATFGHVDFVLIDEAHLVSEKDSATYVKFLAALKETNPNLIVIGFTATGFRMGTGKLEGGKLFDSTACDLSSGESFVWLIEQGYLSRPVPKNPGFTLDSEKISIVAGDFSNSQTSAAMREQNILERAVDLTVEQAEAQGRKCWLTFAQSIDDAEALAEMYTMKGYPHEAVHSKRGDRDEVLERFRRGELVGVTNKDILTTGFDHPGIDLISGLRLTRSPGLWVQMVGRGTRPVYAPGYDLTTLAGRLAAQKAGPKQNCLVLDFCGNTQRLGPINYPNLPKRRTPGAGGAPVVRTCPDCGSMFHPSVNICPDCGYEFPPPKRIENDAATAALVSDTNPLGLSVPKPPPKEFAVFEVDQMVATRHEGKNGKPPTMRVVYVCDDRRFSVWVCFEHKDDTFPRTKAVRWWRKHGGQPLVPTTVNEAVGEAGKLDPPRFIKVWVNTKFPEIVDFDFRGTAFELPPESGGPPLRQKRKTTPLPLPAYPAENHETLAEILDDIPF